jgi:hypothetical protein
MGKSNAGWLAALVWVTLAGCTGAERDGRSEPTRPPEPVAPAAVESAEPAAVPARSTNPPGAASTASLERTAESAGGTDEMAYDLGRQLGDQTTRAAWQNLSGGGCESLDRLGAVISRSAGRILTNTETYTKPEMIDYAEGFVNGMRAGLAEVAAHCSDRCAVLCDAAESASKDVLCQVVHRVGAEIALRHVRQAASFSCGVPCGRPLAELKPADCP